MKMQTGPFTVILLMLSIALSGFAYADILHLEGGGSLRTSNWWIEGDTLYYETSAGTVGIPRKRILRIEKSIDPPASKPTGEAQSATSHSSSKSTPVQTPAAIKGTVTVRTDKAAADQFNKGKKALDAYQFEAAARHFYKAIEIDSNLMEARVGYVVSQMKAGHDGLALSVLFEGLALNPEYALLHELLGDLRNREERVEDAWRSWKRAYELEPTPALKAKLDRADREISARGNFAYATTPHFNVRYDDGKDSPLAQEAIELLEEAWWELTDVFNHQPLQPINVLVYSKQQFHSLTETPAEVAGLFDGKIRVPLGGLERLTSDAKRVLRHELAHAVLHSKTKGNCPRWLHEGFAQRVDGTRIGRSTAEALLEVLEDYEAETILENPFSYPAALSLTNWLIAKYGESDLLLIMDDLSTGMDWKQSVEQGWNVNWSGLLEDWQRDLKRSVGQ